MQVNAEQWLGGQQAGQGRPPAPRSESAAAAPDDVPPIILLASVTNRWFEPHRGPVPPAVGS
jgi:hypothetical protein